MANQTLSLSLNTDRDLIAREMPSQRVLEIAVQAPTASSQSTRPRLNLALVLDRSGSMSGEKLTYVKEAALHVLDMLQEQDRVALVVFDDEITLLAPSLPVTATNRGDMKARVRSVESGGQTNLSDGWLAGCQEIAANVDAGMISRALLLTDGQANEGITDLEELAKHARELSARGISTSTFGVGEGFNEHLLEAMANQGSGSFYYIGKPAQIPGLFAREFQELAAVTARDVEIVVNIPAKVNAVVLGGWRLEAGKGKLRISLGSLYSGRRQEIYVKLLTPPADGLEELVFKAQVSALGEKGEKLEDQAEVVLKYASAKESEAAPHRADVLQRFAGVELAETAGEALKLERNGEHDRAGRLMEQSLVANRPYAAPAQAAEYEQMTERMKHGMDEVDLKTSHQTAYAQKRRREQ